MRRLHPVFNVVKLTPAPIDLIVRRRPKLPPPPELIKGEEEYLVEEILDSKMFRGWLHFLITTEWNITLGNMPRMFTHPNPWPNSTENIRRHHAKSEPQHSLPFLSGQYLPASSRSSSKRGVVVRGLPLHLPKPLPMSHCHSPLLLLPQPYRNDFRGPLS
jgi:hypothetical protein